MSKPKIGIALGGGGAWGWAHIGVIETLADLGVVPDIVAGTSMGAVVGAAFVSHRLEALHAAADGLGRREVVAMLDLKIATGGLIEGTRIEAFLTRLGISGLVEDCDLPFATVATELTGGREIWVRSGPIEKAVRASIGIPGLFAPMPFGDSWVLDGGLVNPVPVSVCRALGADLVIAVDVIPELSARRFIRNGGRPASEATNELAKTLLERAPAALRAPLAPLLQGLLRPSPPAPGYFSVLTDALFIGHRRIIDLQLASDPPDVLLHPELGDVQPMEFHRAREAIAAGRLCAERAKEDILALGRPHASPG